MILKGYEKKANDEDDNPVLELDELLLEVDSNELRMISEFLLNTANNMDKMGSTYDHEHLSDANKYFEAFSHIVVVKLQH